MRSPPPSLGALRDEERRRLDAGEHEALARDLAQSGRHGLAAWVREEIWDFEGALAEYREAERWVDALRCALEADAAPAVDALLDALPQASPADFDAAADLLRARGRNMDLARLLASHDSEPQQRAQALLRAGNRLGAARVLAEDGRPRDALEALALSDRDPEMETLDLAARLSWALGDAEGAARHAQAALRRGDDDPELAALLARALGSLGHDLAAQLVLERHGARPNDDAVPGRYRVTGILTAGLAGAAYVGVDRLTLQEVELHLLLADQPEPIDPLVAEAVDRFITVAVAAAGVGHPAIRPVLRAEPEAGLLVLPQAEGPTLRTLLQPPGLREAVPRARALVAFLLEGLIAAHDRGLVHGSILPSLLATDALGRPQLGPFGASHLSGLAATRTGGLEELMIMTAPELRTGAPPTAASDLFAVGTLMHAMLLGRLEVPGEHEAIAPAERSLIERLTDPDPQRRPASNQVLAELRKPVADLRALGGGPEAVASRSTTEGTLARPLAGVEIEAAESWTPAQLDALCANENPWLQTVLDRIDRTLVLAPWPESSRVLDETVAGWRGLVPAAALDLNDELRDAIEGRLRPSSVVVTRAGPRMLALDDLLSR